MSLTKSASVRSPTNDVDGEAGDLLPAADALLQADDGHQAVDAHLEVVPPAGEVVDHSRPGGLAGTGRARSASPGSRHHRVPECSRRSSPSSIVPASQAHSIPLRARYVGQIFYHSDLGAAENRDATLQAASWPIRPQAGIGPARCVSRHRRGTVVGPVTHSGVDRPLRSRPDPDAVGRRRRYRSTSEPRGRHERRRPTSSGDWSDPGAWHRPAAGRAAPSRRCRPRPSRRMRRAVTSTRPSSEPTALL